MAGLYVLLLPESPAVHPAVTLLEQGIAEGLHLGAQLVVRREGEVVLDEAVGDCTPDTVLPWLSISKVVTAVALLQQWQRQEVGLDDPVAAHIPAFGVEGKQGVTVRHLLTHTAGLRNVALAPAEGDGMRWHQSLDLVCAVPLVDGWVPGRRAAYQPRGTFLALAELVRLVDGRPFDEYVRDEVLRPLGLTSSGFRRPAAPMHDTSGPSPVALPPADKVRPSSGMAGPARDLALLFEGLLHGGGPVLAPLVVEAMTARHRVGLRDETFGVVMDWGLGVIVNSWQYRKRPTPYGFGDHASPRTFGHGGSESSLAFADPEHGLVVAVVCNGMPGEKANHRRTQAVVNAVYETVL